MLWKEEPEESTVAAETKPDPKSELTTDTLISDKYSSSTKPKGISEKLSPQSKDVEVRAQECIGFMTEMLIWGIEEFHLVGVVSIFLLM